MHGGALAAAAAAGALVGFGLRAGSAARPFNAIAALLLGSRARGVLRFDAVVSAVGASVLLLCCIAAGALLGALVGVLTRGSRARVAAFAVALVTGAIALAVIVARAPEFVGPPPVGALSLAQGIVLTIVAAVGFASGMGLAR